MRYNPVANKSSAYLGDVVVGNLLGDGGPLGRRHGRQRGGLRLLLLVELLGVRRLVAVAVLLSPRGASVGPCTRQMPTRALRHVAFCLKVRLSALLLLSLLVYAHV